MAAGRVYRGGKFYISTTVVDDDINQAGFEALTWTEVSSIVTTPAMGVEDNIISQDLLDTDVSQKQKGFTNVTDGELVVAYDPDDAGQAAMLAAAGVRTPYAFKSVLADGTTPSTGTTRYTWGYVGGGGDAGGGGEDFVNLTFQLALNQRPIWVDPT